MAGQFTLGKKERLKSRKQIERLFKQGKSFTLFPYRVYHIAAETTASQRSAVGTSVLFGVGVSTKNFKKAVDRNRIKRLIREAWRLQKKELEETLKEQNRQLNIFFIYTGKELPDYKDIFAKTSNALKKLLDIAGK